MTLLVPQTDNGKRKRFLSQVHVSGKKKKGCHIAIATYNRSVIGSSVITNTFFDQIFEAVFCLPLFKENNRKIRYKWNVCVTLDYQVLTKPRKQKKHNSLGLFRVSKHVSRFIFLWWTFDIIQTSERYNFLFLRQHEFLGPSCGVS